MMQSRRWWYSVALTLVAVSSAVPSFAQQRQLGEPYISQASKEADIKKFIDDLVADLRKGGPDAAKAGDRLLQVVSHPTNKGTPLWLNEKFLLIATTVEKEVLFAPPAAAPVAPAPAPVPATAPVPAPAGPGGPGAAVPAPAPAGPVVFLAQPQTAAVHAIVALVNAQNEMLTGNSPIVSIDAILSKQLSHTTSGVRYWAAKGLTRILQVPPAAGGLRNVAKKNVVDALTAALKAETVMIAQVQLMQALLTAGEIAAVVPYIDANGQKLQAGPPSSTEMEALAAQLNAVADAVGKAPGAIPTTEILAAAGKIANLTAQHAANLELQGDSGAARAAVQALDVCNATLKVYNAVIVAVKKQPAPYAALKSPNAVELFTTIETYTKANGANAIQKHFKDVPNAPRLGEGAPAAAPTTTAASPSK